jgi:hypothetical protein
MGQIESILEQWQETHPAPFDSDIEVKMADVIAGVFTLYFKQAGKNCRIKAIRQESDPSWLITELK